MHYTCASCTVYACSGPDHSKMPANCPMKNGEMMAEIMKAYEESENHKFYVTCSALEAEGHCKWPRLKETVELCSRMGYRRIGLAFCRGLRKEAKVVANLLQSRGFEVVSVICKTGGISKEEAGLAKDQKVHPDQFESMCNPIAQAEYLNLSGTELNIAVGLCVGHDAIFFHYSKAPVTVLITKDHRYNNCPEKFLKDLRP